MGVRPGGIERHRLVRIHLEAVCHIRITVGVVRRRDLRSAARHRRGRQEVTSALRQARPTGYECAVTRVEAGADVSMTCPDLCGRPGRPPGPSEVMVTCY